MSINNTGNRLALVPSWNGTSIYIFLIQLYAWLHFYGLHFTALLCHSPNKPIYHTEWNMFTVSYTWWKKKKKKEQCGLEEWALNQQSKDSNLSPSSATFWILDVGWVASLLCNSVFKPVGYFCPHPTVLMAMNSANSWENILKNCYT